MGRHHIVILGGGFAGLYTAMELEKALKNDPDTTITLVNRDNYFLFTPMQLAAIGRRTGVAEIFGLKFSGFIAWWMWRTIYLSKLPRLEKKLRVALDWTLDVLFSKDLVQSVSFAPDQGALRLAAHPMRADAPSRGSGFFETFDAVARPINYRPVGGAESDS